MKGKKQSAGTNPWTGCAFVSQMPAGPATQCRTREPTLVIAVYIRTNQTNIDNPRDQPIRAFINNQTI